MDELYQIIEQKIKASGYPREISGAKVYNDICDQIAGKENIFRYHSGTGLPISEPVQKMYKYMQRAYTGIDRN